MHDTLPANQIHPRRRKKRGVMKGGLKDVVDCDWGYTLSLESPDTPIIARTCTIESR